MKEIKLNQPKEINYNEKVTVQLTLAEVLLINQYAGANSTTTSKTIIEEAGYVELATMINSEPVGIRPNAALYSGSREILHDRGILKN